MARPLRIEYSGAWYHVMNRGARRRQAIFKNDVHRAYFLSLLSDTFERFNAEWHAYCLMHNHYHLLVRTPEANLQRIMRHINGIYTQHYNRTEHRDGSLFRGRYKSILVDQQSYWTQLSRYIHRNPLEAKVVKRLDTYRWSSYPVYIGKQPCPNWLTCEYILKSLANRNRYARYKEYVAEGIDTELKSFYARSKLAPILGDAAFKQRLELDEKETTDIPDLRQVRVLPGTEKIIQTVCECMQVKPNVLMQKRVRNNLARGLAMYLCQEIGGMKLSEIATRFGLKNYTSASTSIRQFKLQMSQNKQIQKALNAIKLDLTP